ncbi:GTPase family protein [Streptomyces sp. NBC_01373]|uniref:GTPase family protein n=1 Tax=Streptomyces sp. NBC_01373 TaxID=2903843 RepID=UPI002259792F|nr:GTPase domain-containing protein [Streptomyces sp. NBC_01373]MCX4701024.1 GTPase domain-containing protein [Streptomyces sp. NBC_01373]
MSTEWNFEEFSRSILKMYREELRERGGSFNLALFGDAGAGKSTLVNTVFGTERAGTGIGNRQTVRLQFHREPDDGPIGIWDTPGFEIGAGTVPTLIAAVEGTLEKAKQGDGTESIHAVWFVTRSATMRFLDAHAELIRSLHGLGLPVFSVLTCVDRIDDRVDPKALALAESITARQLPLAGGKVFLVNSVETVPLAGPTYPVHGVRELLDATVQEIPESVRMAAMVAQRLDFTVQRARSKNIIRLAIAGALPAHSAPPVLDMASLLAVHGGMMSGISVAYGVPVDVKALTHLLWKILVGGVAVKEGAGWLARELTKRATEEAGKKAAVKGLIKFVPGLNFVVGAVSTVVGAPAMYTIGRAWMDVCEYLRRHPEEIQGGGETRYLDLFLKCYQETLRDSGPSWLSTLLRR